MIRINTQDIRKQQHNFWNNFHFHPTDAIEDNWGRRVLDQAAADHVADTVRMYAMLEDIVTMDESGKLCYDFTENDVRMDYMVEKGYNLLVSYNFIPPCIAVEDDRTNTEVRVSSRYKGKTLCTSLPRSWDLWEEICYAYTKHIVERYGLERVKNWYLQCYNEPDVGGFFLRTMGGTDEARLARCQEYCKMYTAFEAATRRVSDELKIGGPAASNGRLYKYFLNYTKEHNLKLDFTCAHSYGTNPRRINSGECQIDADNNLRILKAYIEYQNNVYPEGKEFILDEWGASGAGFCNLDDCPKLIFRENEIFAAFYGQLITRAIRDDVKVSRMMICLSGSHQPHQLPGQFVEFNGFRSFFTEHFITKPIYNAFRLGTKLKTGILSHDADRENLTVLPTTDGENYAVMLSWADRDFSEELPTLEETVELALTGRYKVTVWCIDRTHTNPYRLWEKEQMPAFPDEAQLERLRAEGIMKPVSEMIAEADGRLAVDVALGCNGLALIEIEKI